MEKKYIKCCRNFHKAFGGKSNHCSNLISDCGAEMFVTPDLYERLKSIDVFVDDNILKLSDHNPIFAIFSK